MLKAIAKIIEMWQYAWKTYMMKVKADKFWHFIAFFFFTIALHIAQVNGILILIIVGMLAIGKELWDWQQGRYFDFGDLTADLIGVFLAYMINGIYIRVLT